MKERDEIEELFSSAFSDFEKMPPIDVKAAIDERIQGALPSKRRKGGIIWIMSSIIALVLLSWMGITFFSGDEVQKNGGEQQLTAKHTTEQQTEANREQGAQISNDEMKETVHGSQKNKAETEEKRLQRAPIANSTSEKNEVSKVAPDRPVKKSTVKVRSSQKGVGANSIMRDRSQQGSDAEKKENLAGKDNKPVGTVVFTEENAKEITRVEEVDETITEKPDVPALDIAKGIEQPSDSSNEMSPEAAENPVLPTMPVTTSLSPWSYTFYAGTTNGFSSLKQGVGSEYQMKEKFGFSASFESNYQLNSRFGIAAGLDFNSRKDVFYQKVNEAVDSSFTGNTLQYIYDPQVVDSIVDSIMVATYSYAYVQKEHQELINHFSIALPVYFNVNVFTAGNWSMKVNAGMRFSYVSDKLGSNPYNLPTPSFKSFGLRGSLRPQILYTTDSGFGIGGYVNVGYDLIPTVQWTGISRSRIDLGVGLLFRFSF